MPTSAARTASGRSFPSGAASGTSLQPMNRSGAAHSSTLMCAVAAQSTDSQGRSRASSPTTFAPVPPKTKKTSAPSPNSARNNDTAAAVQGSTP